MTTPAAEGGTTPPAPPAPPVPPPAAATPPASPDALTLTTAQLNERLERARQVEREAVLGEIGTKDTKAAKAAVEAAQKAVEDAKTVADKLTDTASKLTKTESALERDRKVIAEWAGRQMLGLTAEQQAAVKAIAGDDASEQLRAITALAPTWAKNGQTPPLTPPAPPASGTAPPPNAPPGTQQVSQPNHKEVHATLLKTNPFEAANYALEHLTDVYPEQPRS